PQRGRIRIDDDPPDTQRNIGALLDHTGLYPRLTARENIAYFGLLRGIPTARLKDRIEELLSGDMPFCWPTIYKTKSHQRVLVWADKGQCTPQKLDPLLKAHRENFSK
ncbi:MAG TPA: hypothetical protein VK638_50955, partial [Edaphobacter sp.]|nr:hypothetical protein [Edaphobacter sp.]